MNMKRLAQLAWVIVAIVGATISSYAGSERLIMAMSAAHMDQQNLVYVKFTGPDGAALESDILKQMVIREQDCNSGHLFNMVSDYKIGYAPKNMLVGIYLFPHVCSKKNLCFSVPNLGKVEQSIDTISNKGRIFQLKLAP
ncbi:MAG: hypothetical protein HOO95_01060 [Gallionella sp.]|nr:hypothetical protein [Gallionella sp.]